MLRDLRHMRDMKMLAIDVANEVDEIDKDLRSIDKEIEEARLNGASSAVIWGIETNKDPLKSKRAIALQRPAELQTKYLTACAAELGIPIGQDEQFWQRSRANSAQRILTTEGIDALRKSVRRETKERIELVQSRLAIFFGTVGAVTGIISLILTLTKDP